MRRASALSQAFGSLMREWKDREKNKQTLAIVHMCA